MLHLERKLRTKFLLVELTQELLISEFNPIVFFLTKLTFMSNIDIFSSIIIMFVLNDCMSEMTC